MSSVIRKKNLLFLIVLVGIVMRRQRNTINSKNVILQVIKFLKKSLGKKQQVI
jgi:hypothetical protein